MQLKEKINIWKEQAGMPWGFVRFNRLFFDNYHSAVGSVFGLFHLQVSFLMYFEAWFETSSKFVCKTNKGVDLKPSKKSSTKKILIKFQIKMTYQKYKHSLDLAFNYNSIIILYFWC